MRTCLYRIPSFQSFFVSRITQQNPLDDAENGDVAGNNPGNGDVAGDPENGEHETVYTGTEYAGCVMWPMTGSEGNVGCIT